MAADSIPSSGSRHSILDLAPLELDCMNALWPCEEATVRQVREALRPTRPRAYTTIMTILGRLAQKGFVQRRKSGRAWVYRANVSADQARAHAVSQVVDGFFGGSAGALASHLTSQAFTQPDSLPARMPPIPGRSASSLPIATTRNSERRPETAPSPAAGSPAPANLDTALL